MDIITALLLTIKIKNGTQIQSFPEATDGSIYGDGGNTDCNGQMVQGGDRAVAREVLIPTFISS